MCLAGDFRALKLAVPFYVFFPLAEANVVERAKNKTHLFLEKGEFRLEHPQMNVCSQNKTHPAASHT